MLLAGCATKTVYVRDPTKSETELAVEAIREEWLRDCRGLSPTPPENNIESLLYDLNDSTAIGGECIARHNSLAGYLRPIVQKEKARVNTQEPEKPAQ